jgi:type IV secretory pathway TraG/TraD family ATPase VirD4
MMTKREERKLFNGFNKGLLIDGQNKRLSVKDSFNHLAVIATTGAGKTTSYIIPNLLKLASENNSMIVTDLSGELYQKTSGYLKSKGFKVLVLDPENLEESMGYNPLYYANSPAAIDNLAEILISSSNNGEVKAEDKIWVHGAKTIISILIKTLLRSGNHRYINLANVRFLLNFFGENGANIDDVIKYYADERLYAEWQGFRGGNLKTVQSFISTANVALNSIGINDNLALLTANHSVNFENLRKEKTIIYIRIPVQNQDQYSFLLNLFYKQFFDAMMSKLPTKKDLPVYCLLDEFGNMKIPKFQTIATSIRKFKVSLSIVLQDFSQLREKYGENDAKTILSGGITGVLFFSGADTEITEEVSKKIGKEYVNKVDDMGKVHLFHQDVLSPDEVRTMDDDQTIFVYKNKKPLRLKVKFYYDDFILNSYTKKPPCKQNRQIDVNNLAYVGDDDL